MADYHLDIVGLENAFDDQMKSPVESQDCLSAAVFHDADKARAWLEARLWKNGPICPRCGAITEATQMQGKSHRPGLYQCNNCRRPFTVTVGAPCEQSKIPLNKWLAAARLLADGMSAVYIGHMIGVSKKTAWFISNRIRRSGTLARCLLADNQDFPEKIAKSSGESAEVCQNEVIGDAIMASSKTVCNDKHLNDDCVGSSPTLKTKVKIQQGRKTIKAAEADQARSAVDSEIEMILLPDGALDVEWIDIVSARHDPTEKSLLTKIRDIHEEIGRLAYWIAKAKNPDIAKKELKDLSRATKNMGTVFKALDLLRHHLKPKNSRMRKSNTSAKKKPAAKKAALEKSDRLLQELLTDCVAYFDRLEKDFRQQAHWLRLDPPPAPQRDARGKSMEPDKRDWESKYSALANFAAAEASRQLQFNLKRNNRIQLN